MILSVADADAYAVDLPSDKPLQCWVYLDILPDHSDYITYAEFAKIIYRLAGVNIPEIYTHPLLKNQNIQHQEAVKIIYNLFNAQFIESDYEYDQFFITAYDMSDILHGIIDYYATTPILNRATLPLPVPASILINLSGSFFPQSHTVIQSLRADTNILITPGAVDIRSSNLRGQTHVLGNNQNQPRSTINLFSSTVEELIMNHTGSVNLQSRSTIGNLILNEPVAVTVAEGSRIGRVEVNNRDIRLSGDFGAVSSSLEGNMIHANGSIATLTIRANTFIIGDVEIEYKIISEGVRLEILDSSFNRWVYNENGLINPPIPEIRFIDRVVFVQPNPPDVEIPSHSPTPPTTPPADERYIRSAHISIIGPILLETPPTTVYTPYFTKAITWYTLPDVQPFLSGRFVPGSYRARFVLTPKASYLFHADIVLNRYAAGTIFDYISQPIIGANEISFYVDFVHVSRMQAGVFSLRSIEGDFAEIVVYTEYLGSVAPANFLVYYGNNAIEVLAVSVFQSGYYILSIAPQAADGRVVYVEMIGQLAYHYPSTHIATTTTNKPPTTPTDDPTNSTECPTGPTTPTDDPTHPSYPTNSITQIDVSQVSTTPGDIVGTFIMHNLPMEATHFVLLNSAEAAGFDPENIQQSLHEIQEDGTIASNGQNGGAVALLAIEEGRVTAYAVIFLNNGNLKTPPQMMLILNELDPFGFVPALGVPSEGNSDPNLDTSLVGNFSIILSRSATSPNKYSSTSLSAEPFGPLAFLVPNVPVEPGVEFFVFLIHEASGTYSRAAGSLIVTD